MPKEPKDNYIKFYRSFLKWKWFKDIPARLVYEFLLLSANYTETNYKGVEIPRGSCVATLAEIADNNGLSVQQVRTALNKLKSTGEITAETTTVVMPNFTVFTILNYDRWQGGQQPIQQPIQQPLQQPSNNRSTAVQQPSNSVEEERKERKNIINNKYICAAEAAPEPTEGEAESLFDELWEAYPQKRGKGSITAATKKKLLKVGREHIFRALERYVRECEQQGRYLKNGSTFFNSGYVDYLDENYKPVPPKPGKRAKPNINRDDTDYDSMVLQQDFLINTKEDKAGNADDGRRDSGQL